MSLEVFQKRMRMHFAQQPVEGRKEVGENAQEQTGETGTQARTEGEASEKMEEKTGKMERTEMKEGGEKQKKESARRQVEQVRPEGFDELVFPTSTVEPPLGGPRRKKKQGKQHKPNKKQTNARTNATEQTCVLISLLIYTGSPILCPSAGFGLGLSSPALELISRNVGLC